MLNHLVNHQNTQLNTETKNQASKSFGSSLQSHPVSKGEKDRFNVHILNILTSAYFLTVKRPGLSGKWEKEELFKISLGFRIKFLKRGKTRTIDHGTKIERKLYNGTGTMYWNRNCIIEQELYNGTGTV